MARGAWKWIEARWPVTPVVRAVLVEDIPGGASAWYATGSSVLFVFIIQAATGLCELFFYVPTVDHAYVSLSFLRTSVPFGWLIHNLHYWGATAMVVLVLLHVTQNYLWGAYKDPRQLTWILGVVLFLLTLAMMFTGSPLPWDEKGYWAVEVGTGIAGMTPLAGDFAKRLLLGGAAMGQPTLSRFFILHAAILAGALAAFILIHLVAFRRAGSTGPWSAAKRLRTGPFWPDQVFKDLVAACVIFIVLVGLAAFLPPAFTGAADPADLMFTPKPEWPFLFLYQALKFFSGPLEVAVALGLPFVLVALLLVWPFLDRRPERDPAKRPAAIAAYFGLFAVIIVLGVLGGLSRPGGGENGPAEAAISASNPPAGEEVMPAASAGTGRSEAGAAGESLAAGLIGNARHGGRLYAANCADCHGPQGRGGVANAGSADGTVPALGPIDREFFDRDPDIFASKIDPFLQHGSRPEGPKPEKSMPGFGDAATLTQPQISHLEAYILDLNGIGREKISRPGVRPALFFILTAAIFGGLGLGFAAAGARLRGRRP